MTEIEVAEHIKSRAEILEDNCEVPGYADPLFLKHGAYFAVYILGCIWILLGLRVVSERYFARAIEGLISTYKIPSSIAGATLMAAGTSTPELITSLVGVFLSSKIETGAGTVIGSVIFNQLMIVGLCILVSPDSKLSCSPIDMARDLLYYAISIGLFVYFFYDGQVYDLKSSLSPVFAWILYGSLASRGERLVTLGEAWGFVAAYIAYVILCANWTPILAFLFRLFGYKPEIEIAQVPTGTEPHALPHEPNNPAASKASVPMTPRSEPDVSTAPPTGSLAFHPVPPQPFASANSDPTPPASPSHHSQPASAPATPALAFQPALDTLPETAVLGANANIPEFSLTAPDVPPTIPEVEGLQLMEPESPHPVLDLETCPKASLLADHDDEHHTLSPTASSENGTHVATPALQPFETSIPVQAMEMGVGCTASAAISRTPSAAQSETARNSLDIQVYGPAGGFGGALLRLSLDSQRPSFVRDGGAGDSFTFGRRQQEMYTIESEIELQGSQEDLMKNLPDPENPEQMHPVQPAHVRAPGGHGHGHDGEEEEYNPIEEFHLAFSGGLFSKFFFFLESVWVVSVWSTTGWFRHHRWHMCSFVVCLLWFTIHCVYLIFWLEKAGCVIGISPGVMGVVFGAAGTSIPDMLCSLFVARKGMGSMALTNVWGSNVFDLLFALGVPWVCALHVHGGTIKVQGSDSLCVWMGGLLVFFIAVATSCKFTFNKWHGSMFVGVYILFIIYNFVNDSLHFVSQ